MNQNNNQNHNFQLEFTNLISRLRLIEERQSNMQRKIHLMEQGMLNNNKEFKTEIKVLQEEFLEVKKKVKDFEETLTKISKTLENLATREEVKIIEKYVNLLDPTSFITRRELEKTINMLLEEKLKETERKKQ